MRWRELTDGQMITTFYNMLDKDKKKMELDPSLIWNLVLTLIVAPFAWAFSKMFQEVKRLQILLNQTREEYAKRSDVQEEVREIIAHLQRMEDKMDRFIERNRS